MSDHRQLSEQHAVALATAALKALLTVNTGAVAGLVTFTAAFTSSPIGFSALGHAIRYFGSGVCLTLLSFFFSYLAQYAAMATWSTEAETTGWKVAAKLYWWFWAAGLVTFIASVAVLWLGIDVLADQLSKSGPGNAHR